MATRSPSDLSDTELLAAITDAGQRLLVSARGRQAQVGPLTDDDRWGAPIPLRVELQVTTLFVGALDAYEAASNILRNRASQQVFGCLRFQAEAVALVRWLVEPGEGRDRQVRAYKVLYGQISRWAKLLKEDVGSDPEGAAILADVEKWQKHLRQLAKDDHVNLSNAPDAKHLFTKYMPETGYPLFSMYSELGAHPSAIGNILFSLNVDTHTVDHALDRAIVDRAFWSGVAILHLWWMCEANARALGWDDWLRSDALAIYRDAGPLMVDATRRRKEQRASPPG